MPEQNADNASQQKKPKKYPHEGHRERMHKRFQANGLVGFTDFEVLELFLFYIIPRRDTSPIAHSLIEKFGSLTSVFNAPMEQLCSVSGVGPKTALYLHTAWKAWDELKQCPIKKYPVSGIKDMLQGMMEKFLDFQPPLYCAVLLDDLNQITFYNVISGHDFPSFGTLLRAIGVRTENQMAIIEWGTLTSHTITKEHTAEVRHLIENLNELGFILWDYIALPSLDGKPLSYRRRGQLIDL